MRNASQRRAAAEFYRLNMEPIVLPAVSESAWPGVHEQMVRLGVVPPPRPPKRLPIIQLPQ